ncbi:MAG TPA: hypothetical protein VL025_06510, partial [Thermoanaerobaculia bacterium]|nr:hypothetical protein [Thermoanaerobaculia bacterium]
MGHLTDEEVDLFLAGRLDSTAYLQAVRHLIAGCLQCQAKLGGSIELGMLLRDDPGEGLFDDGIYDEAIDRALAAALNEVPRWEREKEQLGRLLAAAQESPEGIFGVPEDVDFNGWPLVEALLEAGDEERFRDRERMRSLAFAATITARNLDPGRYGPAMIQDCCARTSAELANAYRLNDEFE